MLFSSDNRSKLTSLLVKQIEDGAGQLKLPDVKQAMYMIVNSWREISSEIIINCWSKCDILINYEKIQSEINSLMLIDTSDILKIEINLNKINLSRFS